uniref:Lipase 3646 n=1 Tax=Cohnella sp. A01 TaxID=1071055 RepID=K7W8S6_9BACL|nr:lipase 3646 [Cohnella sp. A01]
MRKGGYDPAWAIFLAAVCSQTYEQYNNKEGQFVVPLGYRTAFTVDATSFDRKRERFGFILESDRDIVVAFRGTSSTADWVSDALAYQIRYPYRDKAGQTHQGFTHIYRSARARIVSALTSLPPDKPVYVAGHSLGGALAVLCALDLATLDSRRLLAAYTFGAPRTGDPGFARAFNAAVRKSFRIANPYDAVAQLPPFILRMPGSKKTYYYSHVRGAVVLPFQNGSPAANHLIGSYFAALAARDPAYAERLEADNPGFCPVRRTGKNRG